MAVNTRWGGSVTHHLYLYLPLVVVFPPNYLSGFDSRTSLLILFILLSTTRHHTISAICVCILRVFLVLVGNILTFAAKIRPVRTF